MITVITGVPGSGKTLFCLDEVRKLADKEGRTVYYSGIKDLKLPWVEFDALTWPDLPTGSIIVIDECQTYFRPRANGSTVPRHISEFETHRHKGFDVFLITQHPMLIDQNIRRLCGRHVNVVRAFGMNKATLQEWNKIKENCDKNATDASKRGWDYPKDVFNLYKSAELHTHRVRIPREVFILVACVLAFAALGWYVYKSRIASNAEPASTAPSGLPGATQPGGPAPLTSEQKRLAYLDTHVPRVSGLPHTAPVYDSVTKPVHAPYPAACIQSATRCQCYTQQGTRLDVSSELCKGIAQGGFFVAWDTQGNRVDRSDQSLPVRVAAGDTSRQTGSLP